MTGRLSPRLAPLALAALLLAGGCHKGPQATKSLDAIDKDLVASSSGNRALASAIHIDPAHAGGPTVSLVPHKGMPVVAEGAGNCLTGLAYNNDWAAKLPADLPMHPQAKLQEAAGHDGACPARVASFDVAGDRQAVLDWYRAKAQAAGYSVDRADKGSDWILAGDKGYATYIITIGPPVRGETPVDYIWARGG